MNLLTLGADISELCTQIPDMLQIVGYVLYVFKIAIPLIIIALGMFDFGKAVVAEKEDETKKMAKRLIFRIVAGFVIFFIPTIVMFLFGLLGGYNDAKEGSNFEVCENCILRPSSCPTNN